MTHTDDKVPYTYEAHKRAVEIEAALAELAGNHRISGSTFMERAEKALLPIYEPLVNEKEWGQVDYETERDIGAAYLEAYADRLEVEHSQNRYVVRDMRECAKLERAIGS